MLYLRSDTGFQHSSGFRIGKTKQVMVVLKDDVG